MHGFQHYITYVVYINLCMHNLLMYSIMLHKSIMYVHNVILETVH